MQSYLGEFENNGGMVSYNSTVKRISIDNKNARKQLQANKTFLAHEATAYVTSQYGGDVSGVTDTEVQFNTAHNFVVK